MEATPFEQDVLAVATIFTLVPTVLPFAGLETVTPAKADVAAKKTTTMTVSILACFFILNYFSPVGIVGLTGKALQLRGIHRSDRSPLFLQKNARRRDGSSDVKRTCIKRRRSLYTGFTRVSK